MSDKLSVAADADVTPLFSALLPFGALRQQLLVQVNDNSYRPKSDDVVYDWVNRVAIPAFRAYAEQLAGRDQAVRNFCTLGTGTGCDALAAIEVLRPSHLVMTDLHAAVVDMAFKNVTRNLLPHTSVEVCPEVGTLCVPLAKKKYTFDLIYENLPNLPMEEEEDVLAGQNSSSYYVTSEYTEIPDAVRENRLVLHYTALLQARDLLSSKGEVLCSIGARCPIANILGMVEAAGYQASPLIYTWKMQSEPEDIIGGYAAAQAETGQRFVFYPREALEETFGQRSPAQAAAEYEALEAQLKPFEIDAPKALELLGQGKALAHTVVVIKATYRGERS